MQQKHERARCGSLSIDAQALLPAIYDFQHGYYITVLVGVCVCVCVCDELLSYLCVHFAEVFTEYVYWVCVSKAACSEHTLNCI